MGRTWTRDPATMERYAKQIGEKKTAFDSAKEKTISLVKGMKPYFDDPTSRKYVKQFEDLEDDMKKLSEIMDDFSNALSNAAKVIRESTDQS